jgi:hypothetical protein
VQVGNYSRFFGVPSLRGPFFPLESAHRACGVGPSVGMRDGVANKFQSTPRVTRIVTSRRLGLIGRLLCRARGRITQDFEDRF